MRIRIFVLLWFVGVTTACHRSGSDPGAVEKEVETGMELDAGQLEMAGVEIGKPVRRSFAQPISCSGTVEVPPQNIIQVHAPVGGFIREVGFKPGHRVKKGTVLARLEHPELIRLQRQFLESAARWRASRALLDRTETLAQTEAASQQQLEEARAGFEIARAHYLGLSAELRFLGIDPEALEGSGNIQSHLPVHAPSSGIVDRVGVNLGQLVSPEDLLYQLVDLSHMHLDLRVFAADLGKVRPGQRIEAVIPGTRDTIAGEVYLIGPSVDPQSGTAMVHGHFLTGQSRTAPGTFLQAVIQSSPVEYWAVPEEAILEQGGQSWLFLSREGQMEKRPVKVGPAYRGWVALPDWDPARGEQVVLGGAYYLQKLEAGEGG